MPTPSIESRKSKIQPLPGPRSLLPGRVFLQLRRNPLTFLTHLTQTYGDISTFSALGQRYVVLNHPDLAKEVLLTQADAFWKGPALQRSKSILGEGLLTAEGDAHKSQRRIMQPAFHAKRVEAYAADVLASTHSLIDSWNARPSPQPPLDIRHHMMGLTLVIAGRTLFGTMLTEEIDRVRIAMEALLGNYSRTVVPWGPLLNHLPLPSTRRLKKAQHSLNTLISQIIETRRKQNAHHANASTPDSHDLLSSLLAATDPDHQGTRLTDQQLRDQAITILTAGHETTANAMTFTLHLLAKHRDEQQKLRAHIHKVLGSSEPAVHHFDALHRVRWVLSESMRLFPPAWTLGRQSQRPVTLGTYQLPAKATVLIPQWTLHRDPRFFPDPLAFTPDRWQSPTHPRHAYIPFSTGPRNCIGESFAWVEMILALSLLIQKFEFSLPPNAPDLRVIPAITLRPRGPVPLLVTRAPA